MLPVEPKLGKMLILGAIFNCLNPIMTVVAGLSVRDPFLMPFDRRDVSSCLLIVLDGTLFHLLCTINVGLVYYFYIKVYIKDTCTNDLFLFPLKLHAKKFNQYVVKRREYIQVLYIIYIYI